MWTASRGRPAGPSRNTSTPSTSAWTNPANRGRLDLDWVEREWLTLFPTDDPRWARYRAAVAEYYDR
jgi:hypothetical protein